jgi:hypothetical protein
MSLHDACGRKVTGPLRTGVYFTTAPDRSAAKVIVVH